MTLDLSNFRNKIIAENVIQEKQGIYCDFPQIMLPQITEYLFHSGIKQLYCHQVEMFEKALNGENIVIATSTASGKTLSFLLPILQEILKDPLTRALFVYPTKALASDQFRSIAPLVEYFGQKNIQVGVYDGDTPVHERSRIRNSANIILTNPEMLNSAFLPHHSSFGFNFVFSNLKYVVLDELHSYRGTFGSHLANVFRRLDRVCKFYNSSPKFLCSSATIANPVELAQNICGKPFTLIDKDGSPSPEKHFYIWQPPLIHTKQGEPFRIPSHEETSELIPYLIFQNSNFLAFCKSRKTVEIVLKEAQDKLKYDGIPGINYSSAISGYRGGYKPQERKEIEAKMISGEIKGLVSTNALELGIDIGKIETVIMTGFPGTRASFWQEAGRAGRKGNIASIFLILDYLPFDQYLAINNDWLFKNGIENAVIDQDNLFIQLAHIRAAAAELPLSLDDAALFPDLGEIVSVLLNAKEVKKQGGRFAWCGKDFPAGDYSLRNIDKERYSLNNIVDSTLLTEMDTQQAFFTLYPGAIYLHNGLQYQVEKLNIENRVALARPVDINYYTEPLSQPTVNKIKDQKNESCGRTQKHFGDVNLSTTVVGYTKFQFHNHQNLGFENLEFPLNTTYDTEGLWIDVPKNVCEVFDKLQPNEDKEGRKERWFDYYDSMSFALLNSAMMITMTTKNDIATGKMIEMVDGEKVRSICVFDKYIGGLGYAEKGYDYALEIVEKAVELVGNCKCKDGCPICVGDYHLDKIIVHWGLKNLLIELDTPKNIKIPEAAKQVTVEKLFTLETLKENWEDFIQVIIKSGEYLAKFLSMVDQVQINGSALTLIIKNEFLRNWILDEENFRQLRNVLKNYIDVPRDFSVITENNITISTLVISPTVQEIEREWNQIRKTVKNRNSVAEALLISSKSMRVESNTIWFGFSSETIKTHMEKEEYLNTISQAITEVLGKTYKVRCEICPQVNDLETVNKNEASVGMQETEIEKKEKIARRLFDLNK